MTKLEKLRKDGASLYLKGNVRDALKIYKKLLNNPHYNKKVLKKDKLNDLQGIVNMLNYLGMHNDAILYAKKIYNLDPKDFKSIYTLSINYNFVKDYNNAIKYALEAIKIDNNNATIYSLLAEAYLCINDLENSKAAGIKSLDIKEKRVENSPSFLEENVIVKPFNKEDKSKNVISFSLFGDSPRYCENAVINAKKVSKIYPFWTCRFYCSTDVPKEIIQRLKDENADVIIKDKTQDIKDMLFWRFSVISDKTIDRYIVRDCDSVISFKEAKAVDSWVKSDKKFHIMRDYYTHTDLILAGMFGGVQGLFNDIEKMISDFKNQTHTSRTHLDQNFLAQLVWPSIKNDVLIHDSCFTHKDGKSIDFPDCEVENKGHHIGQNEGNIAMNVQLKDKGNYKKVKWSIIDKQKNTICEYHSTLNDDTYQVNIPNNYAMKLQNKEYNLISEPY